MRFLLTRFAVAVGQLAVVLLAAFGLTALLPGDAAAVIGGERASAEELAVLRDQLGLDRPLPQRFGDWLGALFSGDLGRSLVTGVPVSTELAQRFASTAILTGLAMAVLFPLAAAVGVTSGLREGSRTDRLLSAVTVGLHAIPEFVLGLLVVAAFSVYTGLFPATTVGADGIGLLAQPAVLVLPVTVLLGAQLGDLARQVRIGVAAHSGSPSARHLRLLGLDERTVLLRHVLPNALAPLIQQSARTIEGLFSGALVVETLFSVRGLGTGFIEAVQNRDFPAVQGYVLVFAILIITVNLLGDLLAHRFTPQRERAAC
ncbi:ABC transporter permease [Sciscionella marina]|uniref:ABC transporter permease n=1 Tax=Sciscionella marina TaxID=508770 RepID=UPI00037D88BC|nr:ABC transporter permease [Sciscionella marina]